MDDPDQPALPFHKDVDEMTMTEYLQQAREENKAWVADFWKRYEIDSMPKYPRYSPEELAEAMSHHAESHYGAH